MTIAATTNRDRRPAASAKGPATTRTKGLVRPAVSSRRPRITAVESLEPGQAYELDLWARHRYVESGVQPAALYQLARAMGLPRERLMDILGLGRATVDRHARSGKPLPSESSSRILDLARLIGQVQALVNDSGAVEAFDAAVWLADWIDRPVPALGGRRPSEFMKTSEGRSLVESLVARMAGGSYA